MERFYMGAYWGGRPRTLREYCAESKRFLLRLRALHPVFQSLVAWVGPEGVPVSLPPDLSPLEELLLRDASGRDALFSHCNAEGEPTLDSTCQLGFITSYSNEPAPVEERVGLMITAGSDSAGLGNAVVINFPRGVQAFREHDFVRMLLELVVDCWAPGSMVVSSHAFNDRLEEPGGENTIGWMNWFSELAVREALPEDVDCTVLRGGWLVSTAREAVSPDVPGHVATARRIRDRLSAHGLLP